MAVAPNIYSKAGDHKLLMGVESVGAPEAGSSLNEIRGLEKHSWSRRASFTLAQLFTFSKVEVE